ncbi:hypothetical protein [Paenibacillus marinisediminis]
MAVRFTRPYKEILLDMAGALGRIEDSYTFLDIEAGDWEQMTPEDRYEVLEALADDLFYGLGQENILFVGSGSIRYDREFHNFEVSNEHEAVGVIALLDA